MYETESVNEHCIGCVYFPPNLPEQAYASEDYRMLQAKSCSFDYQPADNDCALTRKTSCSLVDMKDIGPASQSR